MCPAIVQRCSSFTAGTWQPIVMDCARNLKLLHYRTQTKFISVRNLMSKRAPFYQSTIHMSGSAPHKEEENSHRRLFRESLGIFLAWLTAPPTAGGLKNDAVMISKKKDSTLCCPASHFCPSSLPTSDAPQLSRACVTLSFKSLSRRSREVPLGRALETSSEKNSRRPCSVSLLPSWEVKLQGHSRSKLYLRVHASLVVDRRRARAKT